MLLPNWMDNSTSAFHKTCIYNKDVSTILGNIPKTKVRYMPLFYQQRKTPPLPEAIWNIRHAHPSSLEQSCQGATYHKRPILFRKIKARPIASGNLKFRIAGTIPYLEPPAERKLPRMAKICRLPKDSRNTLIYANIVDTSNTLHSLVPSHMYDKRAC